ncbi:carbohydrate ABC transporter permease [Cohnella fermenti]|uniref:Carbohydrate ABC transporter permease n=1 Tax=Cohnella fermenti TaxID=2565925 RepID=A0A4S4C099_9BACL|nr:carbohydrate ABC transporter permease [Cohnella fermenti]THF80352.1 carbohydrate ABC transporter permease [Cohnella fermenti]
MRTTRGEKVFQTLNMALLSLLSILFLYPYLNQLAISLNDGADTAYGGITIFPRVWTLENFAAVFSNESFTRALFVTVARVVVGTATGLVVTLAASYALLNKKLPGRNAFLTLLLIPTFIQGGLIPTFMLYRELHLINNFWVYILPSIFVFYNMLIMRAYLETIPASLEESAKLDGANSIQILFKLYLPLSMPVVATISLWIAVTHWNDWTTTLMFVQDTRTQTLQFMLYKVLKESELMMQMAVERSMQGGESSGAMPTITPTSVRAATLIVSTLPIVMVYPFIQKHFVKGVMLGAIKE